MNIRLQSLINAIMFDRENEFSIILDQWSIDLPEITIDHRQKNLVHFLSEHGKASFLRSLIEKHKERHQEDPPSVQRTTLERWVNAKDIKGNTPIFYATYNGHLV
jgi:hypothetical protein